MKLNIYKSLAVGLIMASVISCAYYLDLFTQYEWNVYDSVHRWHRADSRLPDNIKIILIDDASLQYMDPVVGRWPWPRNIHADIVDYISKGNPKAIIFDILFVEQQQQRTGQTELSEFDQRLAIASLEADRVIHALQFNKNREDESGQPANKALPASITNNFSVSPNTIYDDIYTLPINFRKPNTYLSPIDALTQTAKGLGVVSAYSDTDGVLRRSPLLLDYQGRFYPALSIAPLIFIDKLKPSLYQDGLSIADSHVPLDKGLQILVNYYGEFQPLSMSGVLDSIFALNEGKVEELTISPDEFADKYVFIGASAVALHDNKTLPLRTNAPGVFMHASILGNILQGDFLYTVDRWLIITVIFILSLATVFSVTLLKHFALKITVPLLIALAYLSLMLALYHNNIVLELLAPLATVFATWVGAYSLLLLGEERERNKVRKMFSQYVSPAALAVMVDQYEDYVESGKGSREQVSILFSDIRGFTSLSETVPAEVVVEMLNFYFSKMNNAIHQHHGTIDKFIGDAIMAIWGAPIKDNDHAQNSVNAAIAMLQALKEVNHWLENKSYPPINIGIGINTGDVILGSIGSELKADYTVIGDNVNLASRLEGITKTYGCPVLISQSTYQQLHETPCLLVDRVRVKGKQQAIEIYAPVTSLGLEADTNIVATAEQAFEHYLKRQWQQAGKCFEQLPIAPLRELYSQRCQHFANTPPPENWDGVCTLTTK